MKRLICHILVMMLLAPLSGCGSSPKSPQKSMKAVIKAASALTTSPLVAGIDLTITVPPGVAPPLKSDGKVDVAATVAIFRTDQSIANSTLGGATYTPATATAPGQVTIAGLSVAGFAANDTITISLDVSTGSFPTESDFTLLSFEAFDTNGAHITGLTPTLTTAFEY